MTAHQMPVLSEQERKIITDTCAHMISRSDTSEYSANFRVVAQIALAVMDANQIGVVYIDPEDGEPTVGWIEEPWDMPPGTKLYTFTK